MVDVITVANEASNILHFLETTLKFLERKGDVGLDRVVKWRIVEAREAAQRLQDEVKVREAADAGPAVEVAVGARSGGECASVRQPRGGGPTPGHPR